MADPGAHVRLVQQPQLQSVCRAYTESGARRCIRTTQPGSSRYPPLRAGAAVRGAGTPRRQRCSRFCTAYNARMSSIPAGGDTARSRAVSIPIFECYFIGSERKVRSLALWINVGTCRGCVGNTAAGTRRASPPIHTRAMARVERAQRTSLYRRMHAQVTSPCDTLPDKRIGRATSVLFSLSVFHLNRKVREVAHECPRSRRCARRASPPGGVFHASLHGGVVAESVPHEGMFHVVWTPLPSESCVMRWLRMRPTNQTQPLWVVSRPPCDWPRPGHDIGRPIKARLISISGAGPLTIKASCAPRQSTPRTNIYGHDPAARHCPCQGV